MDNLNGNHEDTLKNIIFDYLKHQGMFGFTYIMRHLTQNLGFKESASKFAAALKLPEEETQLDDENDDAETRLELTNLILDGRITEAIDLGYGLKPIQTWVIIANVQKRNVLKYLTAKSHLS